MTVPNRGSFRMVKSFHNSVKFTSIWIWIVSIWWLIGYSQGDVSSTSSRIKLNYSFFPKNYKRRGCFAEDVVWSRAPLSFDSLNPRRSLYLNSTTFDNQLRISCVADEPLIWILNIENDVVEKTSSHYLREGDDNDTKKYHVCIILKNLTHLSGSLRCESVYNESLAAEIFINNEAMDTRLDNCTDSYVPFIPQSHGNGSRNVVPCVIMGSDPGHRAPNLLSSTQGSKKLYKSSGHCLKCVCKTNECSSSSNLLAEVQSCKRFQLGRQFWTPGDGDRTCPPGTSSDTLDWPSENYDDCDADNGSISCTDICLQKTPGCSDNFRSARCLIDIKSVRIPDEQLVDYDYRIGFLLNETVDYEATYVCAGDEKIGIQHYYPLRPEDELNSTLELLRDRFDETTGGKALSGIVCTVDSLENAGVTLSITPCESLTRCARRDEAGLRYPYKIEKSKEETCMPIRQLFESSDRIGQVINSPTTAGLVSCIGLFEHRKYVQKFDYFFMGIDLKRHMVSENPPLSAILVFRQLPMSPEFSNIFKYSFECIISTFIFYRTVEVTMDFKGGRSDTVHLHAPPNHNVTMKTELYILDGVNKTRDTHSRVLINITTGNLISVTCAAPYSNTVGWASLTLPVKANIKDRHTPWITPVLLIAAAIVTVSVAISAFAIYQYKKSKKIIRSLTDKEVEEFHNGIAEGLGSKSDGLNVDALAFPTQYRIASDNLQISSTEVLGEGEFGRCVRGDFGGQPVAVKVLKSSVDVEYFKNFLREVKLLAYIGNHDNVVIFHGAVVDKITENLCEVVVELSPYGDLHGFLKKHSQFKPGEGQTLEDNDLISFCYQIASGMDYLCSKHVIHGDLAARNVLVFENYKVKITDFGLSRKLYDTANYTKKNRMVRLPWRWMSLESLKYLEFSVFSDVWSFGVTAWEIFTLGQVPFAGFNWTADFIDMVEQGLRLGKPHRATQEIYEYLKMCWHEQPENRPSFLSIKSIFAGLMEDCLYDAPQ